MPGTPLTERLASKTDTSKGREKNNGGSKTKKTRKKKRKQESKRERERDREKVSRKKSRKNERGRKRGTVKTFEKKWKPGGGREN